MSFRTLYILSGLAAAAGFGISYFHGGFRGLGGYSLGLFATGFGIAVWWFVTGIVCHGVERGAKPMFGTIMIVLAFMCKLPVFLVAANLAIKMGGEARGCFIGGLGLVYSCLVGRGLARDANQPE